MKQFVLFILSLLVCLNFTNQTSAQPGTLDQSFGNGGKVKTLKPSKNYADASFIQKDGKILVCGSHQIGKVHKFIVIRYNADGSLDTTFSNNGILNFGIQGNAEAASVIEQPDGKILAGGGSSEDTVESDATTGGFALARFLTDGTPDSAFANNGVALLHVSYTSFGYKLLLQPDGKILFAGRISPGIAVLRYNINGTLDSSFGTNGVAINTDNNIGVPDMVLLKNGKIIVSVNKDGTAFYQFTSTGQIDNSFGKNGVVQTGVRYGNAMILQNDSNLIVTSDTTFNNKNAVVLVRFDVNGALDASFGTKGKAIAVFNSTETLPSAVAIEPGGKLIAATSQQFGDDGNDSSHCAVFRFTHNGKLDSLFGLNGYTSFSFGKRYNDVSSLSIQPDGKIIVFGDQEPQQYADSIMFAVARLINSNVVQPFTNVTTGSTAIKLQNSPAIQVYPNPVTNVLYVRGLSLSAKSSFSIINADGIVIKNVTTANTVFNWNVQDLSKGIYFLKILQNNTSTTVKFIKQ